MIPTARGAPRDPFGVADAAALAGGLAGGLEGAALADALADALGAASSPSRFTSPNDRDRLAVAVHVTPPSAVTWCSDVSCIAIDVSVADTVVVTLMRCFSFERLHRVRQNRPPPDCEWLTRPSPGACSQHSDVLQARPAPTIESSPPCSRICTDPPPPP